MLSNYKIIWNNFQNFTFCYIFLLFGYSSFFCLLLQSALGTFTNESPVKFREKLSRFGPSMSLRRLRNPMDGLVLNLFILVEWCKVPDIFIFLSWKMANEYDSRKYVTVAPITNHSLQSGENIVHLGFLWELNKLLHVQYIEQYLPFKRY